MKLFLLGSPKLESKGHPLNIGRQKAFALLAYLSVTLQMHRRETLAAFLWPEAEPGLAFSYLRRDLTLLKKELGNEWFEIDRHSVGFVSKPDFWLDTIYFKEILDRCSSHGHPLTEVCPDCMAPLGEAVELYRGDFLAGLNLPDSSEFDEWKEFEIQDFRADLAGALTRLIAGNVAKGNYENAIAYARRWLRIDPLHEPAHRQLIELFAWSGNWPAAEQQYEAYKQMLYKELKLQPEETTQQLYRLIKDRKSPRAPVVLLESAPRKSKPQNNLPPQLTSFVGRKREIGEITHLLGNEANCRLLTLVGPGGIGKTRLAIQVANQMLDVFPNGVFLVSLATVESTELLVPSIADALALTFHGRMEPKAQLLNFLREKELLLVLDSFEHLARGGGLLIDILDSAPRVKLFVTSRERLNLSPEWNYSLEGLTFPEPDQEFPEMLQTALMNEFSAVGLFLERVYRLKPGLSLSAEDVILAARICQLVEGIPLGIELASSWIRVLSLEDIAAEIHRDLDFLNLSARDVPDRHSSLRAVFEHSWLLLSENEKEAYKKLSIFRGGFQRIAAEQIFGISLRLLSALVDKSLIYRTPSGRYSLHGLSQKYAEEKLDQSPHPSSELKNLHCSYYASYLAQREDQFSKAGQENALSEIAVEIDNIRSAWRWAVREGRLVEIGIGLESLHHYYYSVGWVQEGEQLFHEAAERVKSIVDANVADDPESRLLFGRILSRQARFAYRLGRHRQAKETLVKSLQIIEKLANETNPASQKELAISRFYLSVLSRVDGEYQAAESLCLKSLEYFESCQATAWIATTQKHLGIIFGAQGKYDLARAKLLSALKLSREIEDKFGIADTLNDLGNIAIGLGDYTEAKRLNQECLAIRQNTSHLWGIGTSLNNLGYLALVQEEYDEARQLFVRSLKIHREIGDLYQIANSQSNLAQAMFMLQDYKAARSSFVEALRHAKEVGAQPILLENIAGIALLHIVDPPINLPKAAELLTLVRQHPACDQLTKKRVDQELQRLADRLSSSEYEAAISAGGVSDLGSIVDEFIFQESLVTDPTDQAR